MYIFIKHVFQKLFNQIQICDAAERVIPAALISLALVFGCMVIGAKRDSS